jgi:hypothetical protein
MPGPCGSRVRAGPAGPGRRCRFRALDRAKDDRAAAPVERYRLAAKLDAQMRAAWHRGGLHALRPKEAGDAQEIVHASRHSAGRRSLIRCAERRSGDEPPIRREHRHRSGRRWLQAAGFILALAGAATAPLHDAWPGQRQGDGDRHRVANDLLPPVRCAQDPAPTRDAGISIPSRLSRQARQGRTTLAPRVEPQLAAASASLDVKTSSGSPPGVRGAGSRAGRTSRPYHAQEPCAGGDD